MAVHSQGTEEAWKHSGELGQSCKRVVPSLLFYLIAMSKELLPHHIAGEVLGNWKSVCV